MFNIHQSTVYLRDGFMPFSEANISIASSPILYGLSIYTVFNVRYDVDTDKLFIFRLEDHYNRLVNSARIMDFDGFYHDWPMDKFYKTMISLLQRNQVKEDVLVRVTVFIDELIAGTKIHGLKNSLMAYIYPMGEILPATGVHLCVSSWIHNSDNAIPTRAKVNGGYVNASLMKNEALLNGYDDAIALDGNGHVTEGTVANIFLVRSGKLITPGLSNDILEGITRSTIIELASDLGLEVQERVVDRSELYVADEMFLCGSSAHVTPVLSVDKRPIASGEIGPITKQLADEYKKAQLGKAGGHTDWLTKA